MLQSTGCGERGRTRGSERVEQVAGACEDLRMKGKKTTFEGRRYWHSAKSLVVWAGAPKIQDRSMTGSVVVEWEYCPSPEMDDWYTWCLTPMGDHEWPWRRFGLPGTCPGQHFTDSCQVRFSGCCNPTHSAWLSIQKSSYVVTESATRVVANSFAFAC